MYLVSVCFWSLQVWFGKQCELHVGGNNHRHYKIEIGRVVIRLHASPCASFTLEQKKTFLFKNLKNLIKSKHSKGLAGATVLAKVTDILQKNKQTKIVRSPIQRNQVR
jgi:hypothetical protein